MGMYSHITETFQKEYKARAQIYRQRLSVWREQLGVSRIERPTNIARARTLGYKAKEGYVMARVQVGRGTRKRPHPWGGRKPGKNYAYTAPGKSLQAIAEERVARKFRNLEVLNSYWVGEDGQRKYFEVILVDPEVYPDALGVGRAFRGLTSMGKRHRGLRSKGVGSERTRKKNSPVTGHRD
jgi:large subunit ribosomal protein L15e